MNTRKLMLGIIAMLAVSSFTAISAYATTWYARDGWGTPFQCTGTTNAVYPGFGTGAACAFNHPRYAIGWDYDNPQPGTMVGGDTLYIDGDSDINPGQQAQYLIGYDDTVANTTPSCSMGASYDCELAEIPAGISTSQPTSIIGTGTHMPQLWGTGRIYNVLRAENDYIRLQWLEITDHDACAFNDPVQGCQVSTSPFGPLAEGGIVISGTGLTLTDIYIHGLAIDGISTGNLGSATFTRLWIIGNGFDGFTTGTSATISGTVTFNQPIIEWNGCVEAYPLTKLGKDNPANYTNCFGQDSGGYGDGLAFGNDTSGTSGNWIITGPGSISFNTQDGLDLLHGTAGNGTIQIDKMRFEGNAGQQLKISKLNDYVTNSVIIADCGWWYKATQSLPGGMQPGDSCRAAGSAIVFNVTNGSTADFYNNTILSNAIAFETSDSPNTGCNASTAVNLNNNIVLGGYNWLDDTSTNAAGGNSQSSYYYNDGSDGNGTGTCGNLVLNEDYNIVYGTKNNNQGCRGPHDKCGINPGFASTVPMGTAGGAADTFYQGNAAAGLVSLNGSSPAIVSGTAGLTYWKNGNDYHNVTRKDPPSIGALELNSCAANLYGCFFNADCCSGSCSNFACAAPQPVVSITSPTSGSSFTAGSNVTITITALETNGTISNLSLYNGVGILLGVSSTSPYNYIDTNAVAGTYTYTATGTDTSGVSGTSNPVTFTITNKPVLPSLPVIAISILGGSAFTAGSNVIIDAIASETNGTISNISIFNGAGVLLGRSSTSPYNYVAANLLAGSYTYTAKATDAHGVSVTSSPITVSVTAPPSPVVTITSPANGSNFTAGSYISIIAKASETNGTIRKVMFYNGSTLLGTVTSSPYTFTWNNVAAGNYSLTAMVYDDNNNQTTSTAVAVKVKGLPVISLVSNNTSFTAPASVVLTAQASESNGSINMVAFYKGSSLLRTVMNSPYTITWNNVAAGNYNLTAIAYNNTHQTTSTAVAVQVRGLPVVSLASNNISFTAPANIILTAIASEADGTISKVAYYNGPTLIGTVTNSPYRFMWINVPSGTYSLTAKATDSTGATANSSVVSVTVNATVVPTVSLMSPVNNASYTTPANLILTADASETGGTIVKVDFYYNGSYFGTSFSSPYRLIWINVPSGIYSFTAIATDSFGVSTTSTAVTVAVGHKS